MTELRQQDTQQAMHRSTGVHRNEGGVSAAGMQARIGAACMRGACVLARGRAPGGGAATTAAAAGRGGAEARRRLRARGGRARQQRGDAERQEGERASHGDDGRCEARSGSRGCVVKRGQQQ
jgi:hypothetical protein